MAPFLDVGHPTSSLASNNTRAVLIWASEKSLNSYMFFSQKILFCNLSSIGHCVPITHFLLKRVLCSHTIKQGRTEGFLALYQSKSQNFGVEIYGLFHNSES
jgi:hypothetical protein